MLHTNRRKLCMFSSNILRTKCLKINFLSKKKKKTKHIKYMKSSIQERRKSKIKFIKEKKSGIFLLDYMI